MKDIDPMTIKCINPEMQALAERLREHIKKPLAEQYMAKPIQPSQPPPAPKPTTGQMTFL